MPDRLRNECYITSEVLDNYYTKLEIYDNYYNKTYIITIPRNLYNVTNNWSVISNNVNITGNFNLNILLAIQLQSLFPNAVAC